MKESLVMTTGEIDRRAAMLSSSILIVVSGSTAHFLNPWLGAMVLDDVDIHRFLANHQQVATLAWSTHELVVF